MENKQKTYKTKQRSKVLDCLIQNKNKHMTAEDIVAYLKEHGAAVGKATVYRTLEKLLSEGNVRKYICEEGKSACFQYVEDNSCNSHFHLKCVKCGKLIHLECDYLSDLEKHIFEHHKFTVDNTKTVLYGICGDCSHE